MKKILTLIVAVFISLQLPSFAFESYELELFKDDVLINNVTVDKDKSQYPILAYGNVSYLPLTWQNIKSLGLDIKFDSTNVYISKSDIEPSGYGNGDEEKTFPSQVIAFLPSRNIYIGEEAFDNSSAKYPILEYKGVLYIPMDKAFASDLLGLDIQITNLNNLRINSDYIDPSEEEDEVLDSESLLENRRIIDEALVLEKSLLARFRGEEPSYVYDNSKEYILTIDDTETLGIYEWNTGDRYVGEFKDGEFHGKGVYTWSSGQKYVGEFEDGDFNGIGRFYYSEESRSKISIFKDGIIVEDDISYSKRPVEYSKEQNVLVLLTEFKNLKLRTTEKQWEDFMFGQEDSIKEYFDGESAGKLNLVPVKEREGTIDDGVIRVRLDYFHPDFDDDYQSSFSITRDSLEKANEYIDFDKYDTNGNGYIDKNELTILNVIAGYEYEKNVSLQSVYAHRGTILDGNTIFDDTDVLEYVMIGELHYDKGDRDVVYMSTIGIAVHEMGHAYGLPDLYDTDYSSNGIGPFGIMGTGIHEVLEGKRPGEDPVELSAWSKVKLNFVEPKIVSESGEYKLSTSRTGDYNTIKINIDEDKYLLIENKNYDVNSSGHRVLNSDGDRSGILIWHIDNQIIDQKYIDNNINNDEKAKGVDLIEADEERLGYSRLDADFNNDKFDPFFKASGISEYQMKIMPKTEDELGKTISIKVLEDGDQAKIEILFN